MIHNQLSKISANNAVRLSEIRKSFNPMKMTVCRNLGMIHRRKRRKFITMARLSTQITLRRSRQLLMAPVMSSPTSPTCAKCGAVFAAKAGAHRKLCMVAMEVDDATVNYNEKAKSTNGNEQPPEQSIVYPECMYCGIQFMDKTKLRAHRKLCKIAMAVSVEGPTVNANDAGAQSTNGNEQPPEQSIVYPECMYCGIQFMDKTKLRAHRKLCKIAMAVSVDGPTVNANDAGAQSTNGNEQPPEQSII
ncbi:uncharacterized protein LOC119084733 [Bradysia coprophila]|uniref:uncharacterized protein LOC119084733 n=1 Tax=Bradysia coprophila TaxID=38358 RepID=UPI00187DA8F1|nr:uncharacterized protein LOC119084733 [Bradysia coprophila]